MVTINGNWYDGKTSSKQAVVLKAASGAVRIEKIGTGDVVLRQAQMKADISDRLGNTPRYMTFPDGSILETTDNAGVDELLKSLNKRRWSDWVHLLESKKRYVMVTFVLVIGIGFAAVKYGVPAASKAIAELLPPSAFKIADEQTLNVLDKMYLNASTLDETSRKHVKDHLFNIVDDHKALGIKLTFRSGGQLGPNAFALPGGTILFTDELVELAENDDELLAVMAHEIGHVVHKHGMRRMVQGSLLSFAIMALTGDATGVSELFLGLPVILTELAYSRSFEYEADQYALAYLTAHGIPTHRFVDILERIEVKNMHQEGADETGNRKITKGNHEGKWSNYLATHPPTSERIKIFCSKNENGGKN